MRLRRPVIAFIVVLGATALSTATAGAATVDVTEAHFQAPYVEATRATLEFAAGPGERNQVTVTQAGEPGPSGLVDLTVVDKGAPLQAGAGCSGGGGPGSVATCRIHAPQEAASRSIAKDLFEFVPDTEWDDYMVVELGDGDDSFDGSSFTGEGFEEWRMQVEGGAGNDTILTGAGRDTITPGAGDDVVHAGGGGGLEIADPNPDGNDLLDLGGGDLNTVFDGYRTEPLRLAEGVLGGAGERDVLEGRNMVVGGSGDDELISSGEWLRGGAGNDKLIGSPGDDYIFGGPGGDTIAGGAGDDQLFGGEGDDTISAGPGDDTIEEREEGGGTKPEAVAEDPIRSSGRKSEGHDLLYGGTGDDLIRAGGGNDSVYGGWGDDRLHGEAGGDEVIGEQGNDLVAGEAGKDKLLGSGGNDVIRAGLIREGEGKQVQRAPVDTWVDQVNCGPGNDAVQANGWDGVVACEHRKLVRAARLKVTGRRPGVATLHYNLAGDGKLTIAGQGVRTVTIVLKGRTHTGECVTRATGPTLARLRRAGRATVTFDLSWHPKGQPLGTETRRLVLLGAR